MWFYVDFNCLFVAVSIGYLADRCRVVAFAFENEG